MPDDDSTGALASVPAAGNRRGLSMRAQLKFFYGPMDCGKSTLALQIDHNHARQGRHGMLLVRHDRSGGATITTRVGLARAAVEVELDAGLEDLRVRLVEEVDAAHHGGHVGDLALVGEDAAQHRALGGVVLGDVLVLRRLDHGATIVRTPGAFGGRIRICRPAAILVALRDPARLLAMRPVALLLALLLAPLAAAAEGHPLTVVIDPGHGGTQDGAPGPERGVWEKDLTLAISKKVAARLREELGAMALLTREIDQDKS